MVFFWGMAAFEALWVAWNVAGPPGLRFDPAPGFVVLLLLGNQVQLFYLPVIQSAQKVLSRQGDRRQEEMAVVLTNMRDMMRTLVAVIDRLEASVERVDDRVEQVQEMVDALDGEIGVQVEAAREEG